MAWSPAITVAEPIGEPISVDQAKEFVSIEADVGEFDALLGSFIEAARGQVEAVTGTRLVGQTIELLADEWRDLLALPIDQPQISYQSAMTTFTVTGRPSMQLYTN